MKIKLLILAMAISVFTRAQMHDLAQLAEGTMIYNTIVYDQESKVFGYLYLYERDVEKNSHTVEFVFLDKNLNKVSNGTFKEPCRTTGFIKSGLSVRYDECAVLGDSLVLTKDWYELYNSYYFKVRSYQYLSLKESKVSKDMYHHNDSLKVVPERPEEILKLNNEDALRYIYPVQTSYAKGLLLLNYQNGTCDFISTSGEKVWSFKPDSSEYVDMPRVMTSFYGNRYYVRLVNDSSVYLTCSKTVKGITKSFDIRKLNLVTGRHEWDHVLETNTDQYVHGLSMREYKGKLYIMGDHVPYNKSGTIDMVKNLGYHIRILNAQGQVERFNYLIWDNLNGELAVTPTGKVDKNYRLFTDRFFVLDDGTVAILAEKVRPSFRLEILDLIPVLGTLTSMALGRRTSVGDFVLFQLNDSLKLQKTHVIAKEKSKSWSSNSDYLFSHYYNDRNGIVFYYSAEVKNPETKKTETVLGINVYDGKGVQEERIPLYSPRKFSIIPVPAKEGYVMLNERNEKEKYNQVRLERLNF